VEVQVTVTARYPAKVKIVAVWFDPKHRCEFAALRVWPIIGVTYSRPVAPAKPIHTKASILRFQSQHLDVFAHLGTLLIFVFYSITLCLSSARACEVSYRSIIAAAAVNLCAAFPE
jgi:hypothetical protein